MLRMLVLKDLLRARRNPLPWLIFLFVPLVTVGLIGAIFGGGGKNTQLISRIRLGVVDEDDSILTRILRGAAGRQPAEADFLEPVFLSRAAALKQIDDNQLSAVVILPKNFTSDYLHGRPVTLELVKNPAESIKPTLVEEGAGILVVGLNGLSRNFSAQFGDLEAEFSGDREFRAWSRVFERIDDNLQRLEKTRPGLAWYTKGDAKGPAKPAAAGMGREMFGYMLLGLPAMFLLFLGSIGIADLHREVELHTLVRFQTVRASLAPLLVSKVAFAFVMLVLCAVVMFGGGALAFGVTWKHPLTLLILVLGYVLFVGGLMAFIVALIPDQRAADGMRTVAGMILGLAGNCAMPLDQLRGAAGIAGFFADRIMPAMPTYWFANTARTLEFGSTAAPWMLATAKLVLLGAGCLALATWLFHRRFLAGVRA